MVIAIVLTLLGGIIAGVFHQTFGVAPILGALLCAACFLKPRSLFLAALAAMLIRDLALGFSLFTLVRLVAISAVAGILIVIKVRPNFRSLLTGLLLSSVVFHLVLSVGDWATQCCSQADRTPSGLMQSLMATASYWPRAMASDLLMTAVFWAIYAAVVYGLDRTRWKTARSS